MKKQIKKPKRDTRQTKRELVPLTDKLLTNVTGGVGGFCW